MDKYKNLYLTNNDFKEFVDKYCNSLRHNKTVDEALKDIVVQNYANYIFRGENNESRV